jgi:hypothetical protein
MKLKQEITGYGEIKGWSTTQGGSPVNALWAIVFATQYYDMDKRFDELPEAPLTARTYIKGTNGPTGTHPNGLIDYGWRVAYCMDGDKGTTTEIPTVEKTDDSYLKSMLLWVNNKLGSLGRLFVFVHAHGSQKYYIFGEHVTLTTTSFLDPEYMWYWSNVMTASDYKSYISPITEDGTHVFLWVSCCHGNGLDSWNSNEHHNNLEVWSFRPYGTAQGPSPYNPPYYNWANWNFYREDWPNSGDVPSEAERFFCGAEEGTCARTISSLGDEIRVWYNDFHLDTEMYVTRYWGGHSFYINWG